MDVKKVDEQFLHCRLVGGGEEILFIAVYASPNEQRRHSLWETLSLLADGIDEPWLLAGDFNEIKSPMEQKGGGRVSEVRCRKFNDWIQSCSLIDLDAFIYMKRAKMGGIGQGV